jgi:hypothetical protein
MTIVEAVILSLLMVESIVLFAVLVGSLSLYSDYREARIRRTRSLIR